ncbi:unnamed protein product, partial [marine sediment metagenome]
SSFSPPRQEKCRNCGIIRTLEEPVLKIKEENDYFMVVAKVKIVKAEK